MIKNKSILNYLFDFILFIISLYSALLLQFNRNIPDHIIIIFWQSAFIIAFGKVIIFIITKIYRIIIDYFEFHDTVSLIKSNLISSIIFSFIIFIFKPKILLFPVFLVVDFFLSTALTVSFRFIEKLFIFSRLPKSSYKIIYSKTLIIGAGEAGIMVLHEIRNHPESRIKVIGFVDDDNDKLNMSIAGIKILGNRNEILKLVKKHIINLIIIAIPSANRKMINDIIGICEQAEVKLKIVPSTFEIISGDVKFEQIRDIKIEELLSREEIKLDLNSIKNYLKNKTVLITGAGGSIGSEISRQIAFINPRKLILIGKGENSIFEINSELNKKFTDLQIIPIIADVH